MKDILQRHAVRELTDGERVILERLIDVTSLDTVLMALSEICGHKAEHIAHAWQDAKLAKEWARMEGAIGVIVPTARGL